MKKTLLLIASFIGAMTTLAKDPSVGYRGFVDWENDIRREHSSVWSYTEWYTGISSTHGYQFNPNLFAGIGVGFLKDTKNLLYRLPLYIDGRGDFRFGRFTPFFNLRLGWLGSYTSGELKPDDNYFYFSPSVGYRFGLRGSAGVNMGIGLTVQSRKYSQYIIDTDGSGGWNLIPTGKRGTLSTSYFNFSLGIDF